MPLHRSVCTALDSKTLPRDRAGDAAADVLRDLDLDGRARRDGGDRRRVGRRQEHAAARARRARRSDAGSDAHRRHASWRALTDAELVGVPQPPRRLRVPVPPPAAGVHARSRTPRCRCGSRGVPAAGAARRARRSCSSASGSRERLTHRPGHAVGRRAAARRDRPRAGDAARRCCWPTSRPAISTSTPPSRCTSCCARCTASTA